MFDEIIQSAFSSEPSKALYHYTTYEGFRGIVDTKKLHLTDARHLNDSQELKDFTQALQQEINDRIIKYNQNHNANDLLDFQSQDARDFLNMRAFEGWIHLGLTKNNLAVFVGSFTEEGNLLSQWRGYCPYGKGVSLGFSPQSISTSAKHSGLLLGRCIYDADQKMKLASSVLNSILAYCRKLKLVTFDPFESKSSFTGLEAGLLTISSLIKHSDFKEEKEWRVILSARELSTVKDVRFREAKNSLVPYVQMDLPTRSEKLMLDEIMLGPTSDEDLAFRALTDFARRNTLCKQVHRTRSPYRQA